MTIIESIQIMFKLMEHDYAIMLSFAIMFQSVYLVFKNYRTIRAPGILSISILGLIYCFLYQFGSVRWAYYGYNDFLLPYDVNLWVLIDFMSLCFVATLLYMLDCFLNKLIVKELSCSDPSILDQL